MDEDKVAIVAVYNSTSMILTLTLARVKLELNLVKENSLVN